MNTSHPPQPTKKIKLKKETIAVFSVPSSSITDGAFTPTATCNC